MIYSGPKQTLRACFHCRQHQEARAKHLNVPVEYASPIGMKLSLIPPDEF
jgi:hypothetical protein